MARPSTGQIIERRSKNGRTFGIRFRAGGKRHYMTTSATTHEEAERALRHVLSDVERGIWKPPKSEPAAQASQEVPTFWTFAEQWYARHALEVQERTREHWLWALDNHIVWFGRHPLDAITAELVDTYKAEKLASGLSPESVNKTLRLLARIMDEAIEYGHVATTNPARGRNRRLRVKSPRRIWLELDEIRSLLDAAGDYRRELATLILAGLRISELGGLRWRAIDLAKGTLTVEESKTEAGEGRRIDLTPLLREELTLHRAEHPEARPDDLVFPTRSGRPRDRSNSRGRLGTILKRANAKRAERDLPPIAHVTNHTLRRTFASLMYEADAQPTDVMAAMGHKSAKLALEVYARKMARDRDTGKRMDALVDWAQMGTNGKGSASRVATANTLEIGNAAQ
jgi:integrase